jgi:hypothetical protein
MTPRRSGQYLAGMCIAGLGVCAGGWLVVTALISAGQVPDSSKGTWGHGALAILLTGAGLALVAVVTFACWAMAWRQVLRADGVLYGEARRRSRRDARRGARQVAREARMEAAAARREARQAHRETRAMEKRERVAQAEPARPVPVNVDLGAIRRDNPAFPAPGSPEAGFAAGDFAAGGSPAGGSPVPGFAAAEAEPEGIRPPNADRVLAQLRDLLGPLITALDAEPVPSPRAPEQRQRPEPDRDDLVAVCANGVVSYDAEEAW